MSVVAAVTLCGTDLTPLLISTTQNPPKDVRDSTLGNKFLWFQTKSGYLNSRAMIFWIKNILIPYLDSSSSTIDKEISPLLLFDNLKHT